MGRSAAGGGGPLNHFGNGGLHQRSLPPLERGGSNGRPPLVQTNSLGRSLPQPPPPPPPPAPSGGGHHQLNLKLGGALGGLTGLFSRKRRGRQIYNSLLTFSTSKAIRLYQDGNTSCWKVTWATVSIWMGDHSSVEVDAVVRNTLNSKKQRNRASNGA